MPHSLRKGQRERAEAKCGGHCWFCGDRPEFLTVDHATPLSRHGTNKPGNLLPACFYCNNLKSNLTVREFRKFVKVIVIRRLVTLGYGHRDLSRVEIVFWGEGNNSPLGF